MTTTAADQLAERLRRHLADELEAVGNLHGEPWRRAVERAPREKFLGDQVYRRSDAPDVTLWEPATRVSMSDAAWLDLAYENTTWVTQFDGDDGTGDGIIQGTPTSSSTLPGLVVQMLEDLNVRDGHNVLEIGTGTGYSTALLCERLGDSHVTSIEVDSSVAARAKAALTSAGYAPELITGDGLAGWTDRGPYDRVIATCSVRSIPPAWLAQAAHGGRILTPVLSWLCGSGLVALQVTATGTAHGRFLPRTVSFMPARPHAVPPLTTFPARDGQARPATYGADIFDDWMGRFLAGLAAPAAQLSLLTGGDGEPPGQLVIDQKAGSSAWLTRVGAAWTVRQQGPTRLWDQIERTYGIWKQAGEPPQHQFTVRITPRTQAIHLDIPGRSYTWALPTASEAGSASDGLP